MSRAVALLAAVGCAAALASVPAAAEPTDELLIVQVAVEQADGALYRGPCGEVAVVDVPGGQARVMGEALEAYTGAREMRWLAITHYHYDHGGGVQHLATNHGGEVDVFYDRGGDRDAASRTWYREYYDWVTTEKDRRQLRIGQVLTLCEGDQQVRFEVLSVGVDDTAAGGVTVTDENSRSACFRVTYRAFRMATCGDLTGDDEDGRTDVESVVAPEMGHVHVAKANHHGGDDASNPTWVQHLRPAHVVISAAAHPERKFPAEQVVTRWQEAGAELWQTHRASATADEGGDDLRDGDVIVRTSGWNSYSVRGAASDREQVSSLPAPGEAGSDPDGDAQDDDHSDGTSLVTRLSGSDRFATASNAATRLWPDGSETVVLATGLDYPDALAGGALAARLDAPLLLAAPDHLPAATREGLVTLGPERVLLLGGPAALASSIEQELAELPDPPTVERVAGADRYATARRVADRAGRTGGDDVVVATGLDYPDALTASSLTAGRAPIPVLLATAAELISPLSSQERALLLGGTAVLSEGVEEQAREQADEVLRKQGPTRYETTLAVSTFALEHRLGEAVPLMVATGQSFPDALTAGALTARVGGPVLLIPTAGPTPAQEEWIRAHRDRFTEAYVIGGSAAVSDAGAQRLEELFREE